MLMPIENVTKTSSPLSWNGFLMAFSTFSATMTLSVYFLATAAELDAVGDGYLLSEAIGTRGADATCGQRARLWSEQRALIATTGASAFTFGAADFFGLVAEAFLAGASASLLFLTAIGDRTSNQRIKARAEDR